MWTALSYVFYAVANVATGGVMVYLFKYVIGRMDLFPGHRRHPVLRAV